MQNRAAIAGAAFGAVIAAAGNAALEPRYYEEARENAADVVVIAVERVRGPGLFKGYGDCRVRGRVEAVERGERYAAGAAIDLVVPCAKPNANIPAGGVVWQNAPALRASERGRAWLAANGSLALHQYEIL